MTRACTDEDIHGRPSPFPQSNLPSIDVSRRLPAELLASVFIRLARDSYIHEKYSDSGLETGPSWVNVSYVCRYWRSVALNCPVLWSYIYIPEISQRWTQELLSRSQMASLKISTSVTTEFYNLYFRHQELEPAEVLPVVETNHSQRIEKLHLEVGIFSDKTGYQILTRILSTARLPCLQYLEISCLDLPEVKSWLLFEENTPSLHTLKLKQYRIPHFVLAHGFITKLRLSDAGIQETTMADFLAMLRRLPHLVHLSVENSLPSARRFLSNGEFDAFPRIGLPHLSSMSIMKVPLSAATALLSCVDIPSRTKVHLGSTFEYSSTFGDYVRLASLLAQRINRSDSPKFRSLTIGSGRRIALAFSTSERVEHHSPDSLFSIGSDDNALLKVTFNPAGIPLDELGGYPVLSGICSQIPFTNIQSVHFLGLPPSLDFWRDMRASLSDVRHIRFSQDEMPNITSMLSFPSHPLTRSWQDGRADGDSDGENEMFLPALEELELYKTTLKRVRGRSDPNPDVADVQELYDAISTREKTRCRLTIKECRLLTVGGVVEASKSVGWWEGAEFRITSNVRYVCYWI